MPRFAAAESWKVYGRLSVELDRNGPQSRRHAQPSRVDKSSQDESSPLESNHDEASQVSRVIPVSRAMSSRALPSQLAEPRCAASRPVTRRKPERRRPRSTRKTGGGSDAQSRAPASLLPSRRVRWQPAHTRGHVYISAALPLPGGAEAAQASSRGEAGPVPGARGVVYEFERTDRLTGSRPERSSLSSGLRRFAEVFLCSRAGW